MRIYMVYAVDPDTYAFEFVETLWDDKQYAIDEVTSLNEQETPFLFKWCTHHLMSKKDL